MSEQSSPKALAEVLRQHEIRFDPRFSRPRTDPDIDVRVTLTPYAHGVGEWAVCFSRETHNGYHLEISLRVTRGEEPLTAEALEQSIAKLRKGFPEMWYGFVEFCVAAAESEKKDAAAARAEATEYMARITAEAQAEQKASEG